MALDKLSDLAWPLGAWQAGERELGPEGSAFAVTGLLGDDGLPFRRGGSVYKSTAVGGTPNLLGLWSGRLPVGVRTFLAHSAASAFWQLAADDTTPQTISAGDTVSAPLRFVEVGGGLVAVGLSGGALRFSFWGGSYGTPGVDYGTGTVAVTNGSRTVVGTGTSWLANADAGRIMVGPQFRHVVASIDSNTQLTLVQPYAGATATGAAYSLKPLAPFTPTHAPTSTVIASVAGRLVYIDGPRVRFSAVGLVETFAETDYHQPGPQPLALGKLRDTLMIFTSGGVYAASNMSYNLTDDFGNPQQRLDLVNADLIAWSHVGIVGWAGALLVPCLDGVWLVDTASAPQKISEPIADLYLGYVRAGYTTGVAEVFNGHYFLPILDASNAWVDTLVCRLRPALGGNGPAWTSLSGTAARATAFAERSSVPPLLLAASADPAATVLLSDAFGSDTVSAGPWALDTGSLPTVSGGKLVPNGFTSSRISRPVAHTGGVFTWKFTTGTVSSNPTWSAGAKWLDANNYLRVRAQHGLGLTIRKVDGGVDSQLAINPGAAPTFANATSYWVRMVVSDNQITGQLFNADPATGVAATHTVGPYTLLGADATKFGRGVTGLRVTMGWAPSDTAERYDDYLATTLSSQGRVVDVTGMFSPSAALKNDADGSAHPFSLTTRAYSTGNLVSNFVSRVRARYVLTDAGSDDPVVRMEYSIDGGATWVFCQRAGGTGPTGGESDGSTTPTWVVGKRCRSIQFRLSCLDPAAKLKLRSIELFERHSGRY